MHNKIEQRRETPGLYSIPDACRELGQMSVWTLRRHIVEENISVTRLGRRIYLRGEEIERIRREGLPSLGSK
jgi:hypothetical protein